jgi:hypothetical protein
VIKGTTKLFDYLEAYWESKQNNRLLSTVLVLVFIVTILIGVGNYFHLFNSLYLLYQSLHILFFFV